MSGEKCVLFHSVAAHVVVAAVFLSVVSGSAHAQAVPSPWAGIDIGAPAVAGSSASAEGGTFDISAAGSDIWNSSDQFHFVYRAVRGDAEIVARIDSVSKAHIWSKGGVMIRSSLSANAAHGYVLVSAGKGLAFHRRPANGGSSTNTAGPSGAAPYWVRLVRKGTTLTAAVSPNGVTWTTVGSDTIALGETAYVGVAVTSHNGNVATAVRASQVAVQQTSTTPVLPAPYQGRDIGAPSVPGSATHSAGTFTIDAAGTDIWGTSDQFHYVYQQITGDVDIRARVASVTYQHAWSKAGVMVREALTAASRHAYSVTSAGSGYAFQRRIDAGGISTSTPGGAGAPPGWTRLVRTGDRFDAYRSADGNTWTLIGSDVIPMASTVYVGYAVTSQEPGAVTRAVLDSVSIAQPNAPSNQPPTVTVASPAAGASFTAPGTVTVSANASDPESRMARVEFFANGTPIGTASASPYSMTWVSVAAGSYSITAVAHDQDGESTTSAPVNITVGAANQLPLIVITSPANGATFTAPASFTVTANASDADGTIARVEFFRDGTLIGTATTAPYATAVSSLPAGTCAFTARAYDSGGASATSAAVSVTVGANQPPTVAITSPASGASFIAPASFTLHASASDPEAAMARVEFFRDGTLIGSDTAAPYTASVASLAAGTYVFTARASDSAGISTTSAAVSVTVAANQLPSVAITSPASGASFAEPASFAITATASDADGTIARVEFFRGTTLIGTDTAAPYQASVSSLPAGSDTFTAVAYDNAGASRQSAGVTITVAAAPTSAPRIVAFTASIDHATVTRYVLEIFEAGADPATATPVATSDLAKPTPGATNEIQVDRSAFFSGLAAGSYQATVRAENSGGSSRSTAVAFTR